jgi:hypothetical protein
MSGMGQGNIGAVDSLGIPIDTSIDPNEVQEPAWGNMSLNTLHALANAGFADMDVSETQTVQQAINSANFHSLANQVVPGLASAMMPSGFGLAINIANLMAGNTSVGQSAVGVGLGAIAQALGLSPTTVAGMVNGNFGQAAASFAQGQLATTIGQSLGISPAVVSAGLTATGFGPTVAGAVNSVTGAPTGQSNLSSIAQAIDAAVGSTPGAAGSGSAVTGGAGGLGGGSTGGGSLGDFAITGGGGLSALQTLGGGAAGALASADPTLFKDFAKTGVPKDQGEFESALSPFLAKAMLDPVPVDFENQKLAANTRREPEMQPYFNYGAESSIDQILNLREDQRDVSSENLLAASGGAISPLMGGGTRHGRYALGGMATPLMVASGGKARVDFRSGDAVSGPGDGQSDDIPAMLADGEFVFPADVVAAIGNGSTKAGSDKLYDMMHGIRKHARSAKPKDLPPEIKSPLAFLNRRR